MKERKKIYTTNKDGIKQEFDVILTFTNELNNKDYVVYTDNSYDKENKLKIYAAIYNPSTLEYISGVETQEEWNEIIKLLDNALIN